MSLEINYIDAPEGAQEKATAEGINANAVSSAFLVSNGVSDVSYATLEPGVWKLDGTMKILPDQPNPGWWSKNRSGNIEGVGILGISRLGSFILSGRTRAAATTSGNMFETPPKLIISFPLPYGTTGFTLTFSPSTNQWCTQINVKWYIGQTLLIDKDYYPTSAKWTLEETVESFDKVEFTFLATNKPGQFAKIQRVEVGRTVLFSADEVVSVRLVNEADPTLCKLPVDTMTFDMHDPLNRSFLPQENQRVELIKDGRLRAVQYIKSSTRKSKSDYTIRCQSSIGLLNDEFLGGLYVDKPVQELLSEILKEWEYELDSVFAEKKISGYIPVCTQREALQQVCFAIGAMVLTQNSSKIRLVSVPASVSAKFTASEIITGGSVKTMSRYARIEVCSHSYVPSDTLEVLMDEEEVNGENQLFTFSYPHYDYEITGGEITGSGDNWVTITANGAVTLSAKTYIHNIRSYVRRNPEATAKERGNYIAIKDATLIHSGNVQETVNRLYSAVQSRQTVSQPVVVSGQTAGQMASSQTPWGTIAKGFISSMDNIMTQTGHIADIQIQGNEIALESVWLYAGELYSAGQEVLY